MQFYDGTNGQGICQEVDRLCDTTDSQYSRKDKTARINQALQIVETWIIQADGTWQFDDNNYTDLPRGTGSLQEGIAQYSFASEYLDILMVEVKDSGGYWHKIQPADPRELDPLSWDEYFGTTNGSPNTGFPVRYDKSADGVVFGPAPTASAVTLTNGLRVTFQRKANLFTVDTSTTADTTQPGFASPFHVILAYMASIPYCMTYKKDRVALYQQTVGDTPVPTGMKKAIIEFYSRREKDKRPIMTMKKTNYV